MTNINIALLLFLVMACDPYRFGFRKNPAYVIDQAFKAITHQDRESFVEVAGKEALCLYGTDEGLTYLNEREDIDVGRIEFKPTTLSQKHVKSPDFIGFWSYYSERYLVDVVSQETKNVMVTVVVDCHYGVEGEKNDRLINLKPKKYPRKECKLVKIDPKTFSPLPMTERCSMLAVQL